MFIKNKPKPSYMSLSFDGIEVGDFFYFSKSELGRNGLLFILDKARKEGVKLIYEQDENEIRFWCDFIRRSMMNDVELKILDYLKSINGESLTVRQIAETFKDYACKSTIKGYLEKMEKKDILRTEIMSRKEKGRPAIRYFYY